MATITAGGTHADIQNYTLSSTDDVQIGFSTNVNRVVIKARTAVDIQVRTSRGAPNYYTIASGTALELDMVAIYKDGVVQPFNLWLRSVSATPVAEVIGLYGG